MQHRPFVLLQAYTMNVSIMTKLPGTYMRSPGVHDGPATFRRRLAFDDSKKERSTSCRTATSREVFENARRFRKPSSHASSNALCLFDARRHHGFNGPPVTLLAICARPVLLSQLSSHDSTAGIHNIAAYTDQALRMLCQRRTDESHPALLC